MDLHEYMYFDISPNQENYLVRCRYCDAAIGDAMDRAWVGKNLGIIEKYAIIHLMQCKPFHEVKKSEIEDSNGGCEI